MTESNEVMLAVHLSYDPSPPGLWFCSVDEADQTEPSGAYVTGSGPDPLSAAMDCAQRAVAQWAALDLTGLRFLVLDAKAGWVALDTSGAHLRRPT